ncbi:MAG: wax ester/triacylglycerol synthase domain-containing protein [Actinomycetota bacterium]
MSHPSEREGAAEVARAGAADVGQAMVDVGSVPNQVGAVLTLEGADEAAVATLATVLAERLSDIPRLRQRLLTRPPGGGPAVWVEDPGFDVTRHLEVVACPAPGDEAALLALAADRVTAALPATSPRWRVVLVTDLAGGRVGVVAVFHHILADGIGGLAVLARLVDDGDAGAASSAAGSRPRPSVRRQPQQLVTPSPWQRALHRLAGRRGRSRAARSELGNPILATRCSLNRPTGPRREIAVVRTELAALKDFAHAHGDATVNDVVLGAVAGALGALLRRRGEHVERLVATVMVAPERAGASSAAAHGTATTSSGETSEGATAGNRAGIAPIALPTGGSLADRLPEITARTRSRLQGRRGGAAAPFGVALWLLARLRLLRWAIDHQRMVHTFVTNLRGPASPVTLAGMRVTDLVPVSLATGNVTVAFAAMSYAGTLTITVVTDPSHHPDREVLVEALEAELAFAPPAATGR